MNLVAASFARHGIECPVSDSKADAGVVVCPSDESVEVGRATVNSVLAAPTTHVPNPVTFPEHNYRKRLQGDPAP
ncbi:MAG TPA: hypothetical protein VK828_05810 [Terriglobales bacterium]|nr:hypothetical protein [Terriglobales bacterium]